MVNKEQIALDIAIKLNSIENIKKLSLPVLDGFVVKENKNLKSNLGFVAVNNNNTFMEQFLTDGILKENETVEERISKVFQTIENAVKNNPLYKNNSKYIVPVGEYRTDNFKFYIYAQDILVSENSVIRQVNAYFIEPESREFYQLSLAAGQYKKSDGFKLLKDVTDIITDKLTMKLAEGLMLVLGNIKYRKDI